MRQLLVSAMNESCNGSKPILLPCRYDGLLACLIARGIFDATFMSFRVSAVNGYHDTQLVSNDDAVNSCNLSSEGLLLVALE